MNILISACLLGMACRYDGKSKTYAEVSLLMERNDIHLIPCCPEQAGGLPTPRNPSERQGHAVQMKDGTNVTDAYCRGAEQALFLAKKFGCALAVLKEKSPSCGSGSIYDGTFSKVLTAGDGVTAELLKKHGIAVIGESQIASFLDAYKDK